MARTAFVSVRAMSDSASSTPLETATTSPAHPRFAEALAELGLTVEVRRFPEATRTRVLADRGLLAHDTAWAAAGTPHTVFPLDPASLIEYAQGRVVDVRERTS